MSKNRNELLRRLAVASQSGSLQEQRDLVQALAHLDKQSAKEAEDERSLDWADTAIRSRMQPRIAHTMHSEQTDWMNEISTTASSDEYHNKIHAEASMWFNRVDNDVKADLDEFAEQARGVARRVTGSYGDRAEAAAQEFLSYVSFLHKQSASGLPQVQQEFDSHDQYAPTPVPPDVFPTFEGPVHPINEWVENDKETNSERPHRAQEVGGAESHSLPDEGESDSVEGYPGSSDSGTGENSSHDTDDAEDRSPNENWPETDESGDAAAEGARPSEHTTDDDLTAASRLISTSLWDAFDDEIEKEARDLPPHKVNPHAGPNPPSGPSTVIGPDGNQQNYQTPPPIGSSDYNQNAQQRRQKSLEMKPDRVKLVEENRAKGIDTPAPAKAASWVESRLREKLSLRPGGIGGGPQPGGGAPGGPGGGANPGAPSSVNPGGPSAPGGPGQTPGQAPGMSEPLPPADRPDHETLMQRRKDIAGVDSFPAPNSPTNNSNTI